MTYIMRELTEEKISKGMFGESEKATDKELWPRVDEVLRRLLSAFGIREAIDQQGGQL